MTRRSRTPDEGNATASSRRYRRVETSLWTDRKFQELSAPAPNAQTLWQYLLTGPRTTVFPGLVVATPAVIGSDLGWPVDRDLFVSGNQGMLPVDNLWTTPGGRASDASGTRPGRVCTCVRDALFELTSKGMIEYDSQSPIILLKKALFTAPGVIRGSNKPSSANQLKGWEKSWSEVPECPWKDKYFVQLEEFCDAVSKAMGNAFRKAFMTHCSDASRTRRGRVADASATRLHQEQDQDQEQDLISDQREKRAAPADRAPRGDRGDVTIAYEHEPPIEPPIDARDRDSRDSWLDAPSPFEPDNVIPIVPHLRPRPLESTAPSNITDRRPEPAAAIRGTPADRVQTEPAPAPQRDSVRPKTEPAPAPQRDTRPADAGAHTLRADARSAPTPDVDEAARRARQSKAWTAWQRMNRERVELAAELGLEQPIQLHHHMDGYKQLSLRIAESGDDADEHLEKVFASNAAVARASRPPSLRFFGPSMFTPGAWQAKLAMSIEDAVAEAPGADRSTEPAPATHGTNRGLADPSPRRRSAGPSRDPGRNAFDAVDQATRAIEARLDEAARARGDDPRDIRKNVYPDHAGDEPSPDTSNVGSIRARGGDPRDGYDVRTSTAHRRDPRPITTTPTSDADDGDPERARTREAVRWS